MKLYARKEVTRLLSSDIAIIMPKPRKHELLNCLVSSLACVDERIELL
jgi:hypothetical protein